MKKRSLIILTLVLCLSMYFTGCKKETCEKHTWVEATCTHATYCSTCGETTGSVLNHIGTKADCEHAGHCTMCNSPLGGPLGHKWSVATYQSPKTCTVCGKTEGEPLTEPDDHFARALEELVTKSLTCQITMMVMLQEPESGYSTSQTAQIQFQRDGDNIQLFIETMGEQSNLFLTFTDDSLYVYQKIDATYQLLNEYPLAGFSKDDITNLPFEEIANMFARKNGLRIANTEQIATMLTELIQAQGIPAEVSIPTFSLLVQKGHIKTVELSLSVDIASAQGLLILEASFSNIGSTLVEKPVEISE